MSIIDKILVILDEGNKYTLEEIVDILDNNYTKQVISASLGRIITKKYAKKVNDKYSITELGSDIITINLENIEKISERKAINSVIFITFNVSEKNRIKRDKFRNYLICNGFGRLNNTFWIGINKNIKDIKSYIDKLSLIKNTLVFESKKITNFKQVLEHTKWNDDLKKEYSDFIKNANIFLAMKNKNKYQARFLVYVFAKLCKKDPILPAEYLEDNYTGTKALNLYNKVRKYCY